MHVQLINAGDVHSAFSNIQRLSDALIILINEGASDAVLAAVAGQIRDLAEIGNVLDRNGVVELRRAA